MTVYSLTAEIVKSCSKNYANLYVGVTVAQRIERKCGSPLRVSCTVISGLLSRLSAKLVTFLYLKTEIHRSCVPQVFTNLSVLAEMSSFMAKINVILVSEC